MTTSAAWDHPGRLLFYVDKRSDGELPPYTSGMDASTSAVVTQLYSFPVDWPFLGLLAALLALECFSSGSTRTSAIAIALPVTFVISSWLPNTFLASTVMQQLTEPTAKAAIFGLLFIALYFVIHRMIFSFGSSGGDVPQALISGVATAIIFVIFWIQTPGLEDLWKFGTQVQLVFNESVRAWWLVGAFAAIAYTRG